MSVIDELNSDQSGWGEPSVSTYSRIRSVSAGYTFYFRDFERGWFVHTDVALSRVNTAVWLFDHHATLKLTTITMGPTVGWKWVGKRGFTAQTDLGVGYTAVPGNPRADHRNGYSYQLEDTIYREKQGSFGWLGGVDVGWSF